MAPLVYLVTGANKGIGYEIVRILSERLGDEGIILLGTRSLENGQAALVKMKQTNPLFSYENVQLLPLDVVNSNSIQAAAELVKMTFGSLHALINNAGISGDSEGADACFNVNVFGVQEVLATFLPIMVPNQSINVVVASVVGAWTSAAMSPELQAIFADYTSLDMPALRALAYDWKASQDGKKSLQSWPGVDKTFGVYGVSKAMVLALARKFAHEHPDITTVMVCPGYCATDINANSGPRSAAEGGERVAFPLLHPENTKTGRFYIDDLEHGFNVPMPQF
ncbi:hypothetical protein LEN26_016838 [Aphanomyces euteiches]|nr:hypothetical protein LEN26_016838 [Aphanomyces euteiches]KAH9124172.1 hypothetical protein AeMF1_005014 [Aphanomyces euteiches]KAH9185934.1 hypothetical protein AeNC1_012091 [Aphanomyces euteiches]